MIFFVCQPLGVPLLLETHCRWPSLTFLHCQLGPSLPRGPSMPHSHTDGDLSLLMDMEPSYCVADPMEGTHRGGMLRPSMHPIKPQAAMLPCCMPQHPKTPPQPIIGHRCGLLDSW